MRCLNDLRYNDIYTMRASPGAENSTAAILVWKSMHDAILAKHARQDQAQVEFWFYARIYSL